MGNINKLLREALSDQGTIFGDILFENFEKDVSALEKSANEKVEEKTMNEKPGPKKESVNDTKPSVATEEKPVDEYMFTEGFKKAASLKEMNGMINTCRKCPLGNTRTNFVFGVGNPNADVMLIGEAPGRDEDLQGEPFVGRAGKLLNDILKAINFQREEVYIANILKCRPPNNRDPNPMEMETCKPYLYKQIDLIKPKVILCLGRISATTLLENSLALGKMRGEVYDVKGVKTMVTYHPAALLRNPQWKRGCWEDVKQFRKLYDDLMAN